MKPAIRQQNILSRLRALQREWRVDDLARTMRVSPLTIRRDLDRMAEEGSVVRTLGGCMAVTRVRNPGYEKQVASNFELKQAIGREAAREVQPGHTLLLNDGSTTFHLASCLGRCGNITVFTNSIAMIGEFTRFSNVRLYILGGEYHADQFCLGGNLTERMLETIETDTVFLGTDAIDSKGRCLVREPGSAGTARMMLRHGRRKILLADATKTSASGSVAYGSLSDFDLWITSPGADPAALRRFRKQTKIRIAKIGMTY